MKLGLFIKKERNPPKTMGSSRKKEKQLTENSQIDGGGSLQINEGARLHRYLFQSGGSLQICLSILFCLIIRLSSVLQCFILFNF